jgi:hypothetical protein
VHTTALARRLLAGLDGLSGIRCNHAPLDAAAVALGLPGLVSLSIEGVEGESLLAELPELAVSSGAACDSASGEPSYVLRALGLPPELAQSTLRIMFGRYSRAADADLAAAAIRRAVAALRAADAPGAPAGEGWVMGEAGRLREGTRVRCYLQVDGRESGDRPGRATGDDGGPLGGLPDADADRLGDPSWHPGRETWPALEGRRRITASAC